MTRVTLLSHFYNESYMLPWWVRHHSSLFDDAVLIDYSSSDNSVDIIKEFAPNWKVVPTKNKVFDAALVDQEIMKCEESISGWKVVLTTTEFLLGDLRSSALLGPVDNLMGFRIPTSVMVDLEPEVAPIQSRSLIAQKPWGVDESQWTSHTLNGSRKNVRGWIQRVKAKHYGVDLSLNAKYDPRMRGRLVHRNETGGYSTGRHHWSIHPTPDIETAKLLWFGLSPWNDKFLDRKAQIQHRIPETDQALGYGSQHFAQTPDLDKLREYWASYASNVLNIE